MLFSFSVGLLMNSGFKWKIGVKTISIVTITSIILSLILIVIFRDRFDLSSSLIDNFVHYSLRVLLLGTFAIFGLAYAEVTKLKKTTNENKDNENYESSNRKYESEHIINEAKLKAEKILFEAEKEAQSISSRKEQIEIQLRELIQTEREVIRNYEKEDESFTDKNIE